MPHVLGNIVEEEYKEHKRQKMGEWGHLQNAVSGHINSHYSHKFTELWVTYTSPIQDWYYQ